MAKVKKSDQEAVTEHIQKLAPAVASVVEEIRRIILDTDREIGEQIKWNSPSFYYTGEMKPFDPKEYKRDIVVMNLHRGNILLVFPTGATVNDTTGLLEGNYTDGRRLLKISGIDDVKAREKALRTILKQWLSLVEK